jgi:membrane protein YdbS with pleckstrin-like domain
MRLWVNQEGTQLGPYSLEEARALVLSGKLSALDWAWVDGDTQWIPLKDVAGFSTLPSPPAPPTPLPPSPAPSVPSSAATSPTPNPAGGAEEILWRGHPSQALLLKLYFFWAIVLFSLFFATLVRHDLWPILAVLLFLAVAQVIWRNLRLRAVQYVVTTQRVRIVSGLLSKDIQEIELFRVKDTLVYQWFIQRLFGLGTITIISGDAHSPRLVLRGVPHAVELRERLRHEVIALRQRYNVRELDMM